jgi:hypothetical protein
MNDFEAWEKIIAEWKEVNRIKRLNQELYDLLGGSIVYLSEYAKKNNITLPNKDEINRMAGRIHILIDKIDQPYQTPNLNTTKNDDQDPDNLPVLHAKFDL